MIQILYNTIEKYWSPKPKFQRRGSDSQTDETDDTNTDTSARDDDMGDQEVAAQLGVALLAPPVGVVADSQIPDSLGTDGQVMDIDLNPEPEVAIPTDMAPNDPDKAEVDSQDSNITPTEIEKTPPPAEPSGASDGNDVVEVLESPPEKEIMSKDPVRTSAKQAFNESNLDSVQAQIALIKLLG